MTSAYVGSTYDSLYDQSLYSCFLFAKTKHYDLVLHSKVNGGNFARTFYRR